MRVCVRIVALGVALLLCFGVCAQPAFCQGTGRRGGEDDDAIKRKQEEARRELENLERLIELAAKKLDKKDPENAGKLREAWKKTREKLVLEDMKLIQQALANRELLKAWSRANDVVKNLIEILAILTGEKPPGQPGEGTGKDKPGEPGDGERDDDFEEGMPVEQIITRLEKMLEKQLEINGRTRKLDREKVESELTRPERMVLRGLSRAETALWREAQELAVHLEKNEVHVFASVLRDVASDMKDVAGLLEEEDTGSYTDYLQKEIVKNLRRLIEALRQMPPERPVPPTPPGPPGIPGTPPPPVPPVAELKLLRQIEGDIHEMTKEIHRAVAAADGKPTFIQKKMINRLAHKQAKLTEMTRRLRESLRR